MMNYMPNQPTFPYRDSSIYRPAYHRIPSTPMRQSSFVNEVNTIVVPSMSSPYYYLNYQIAPPPVIHHTLEKAMISFDTEVESGVQKELVKDVFFSPAVMISPPYEPSSPTTLDEPFETPLLEDVFDLGPELLFEKKLAFSFDMPTPGSLKRRLSHSSGSKKKQKTWLITPPDYEKQLDYFDPLPSHDENTDSEIEFNSPCWESEEEEEIVDPRPTAYPTIYQKLTKSNIDWCRYCGTTEGVNWRPGPWGKRTLCNKHGCDYKGYGFACKLPRLDLTGFMKESLHDRERPVLQLFCTGCQRKESWQDNVLVRCEGCPKAYHQKCCPREIDDTTVASDKPWFCETSCCDNVERKRIVVELSRKRLPLMRSSSRSSSLAL